MFLVLTFSVVDSSSPRYSNRGRYSFVFASLRLCDFALNQRNAKTQRREGAKVGNHRIHQNQECLPTVRNDDECSHEGGKNYRT
ncbi:MAG: hypothetical protein C5S47_06695 [Candidatus Methanogasteraceae archaeon]|nr:MAG: hypothetical protein C5S47_06695 [ANME-2 cluster archaeon]